MLFKLCQALRTLHRNPGFALLCGLNLALGIGTSTAVFSVVNGILLEPLQFPEPDRIVTLSTQEAGRANLTPRLSGGDYVDVRSTNRVFDAISLYNGGEIGVQLRGRAEFTGIWFVNPQFFTVFGRAQRAGAVVSAAFAARHFGDAAHAVGQQLQVENRSYTIAGVQNGAAFPDKAEIWLPAPDTPANLHRTAYNYRVVARLRPGVSVAQAQANLTTLAAQISGGKKDFVVSPLRDQLVGPVRQTLYLLLGAVFLVLLIACVNVSNLLLARATVRTREIVVRAALGATRNRIVRQLMLESLALAVMGGVGGVVLAWWGTRALLHFAPANLPRAEEIHISYPVLLFAFGLSLASSLLFGVAPAIQSSRSEFGGRGVLKGGSHRMRNSLVVAEIALSFVLATGAGLFFRSFLALNATEMGFRPERMLVMHAHAPARTKLEYVGTGQAMVDRLLPRLASLPGVEATGAVMGLPTGKYGSDGYYAVVGRQTMRDLTKLPEASFSLSSPNYFSTLHVPLLQGRDFTARDQYGAPGVAVISQTLARQTFGWEDPIGHQIVCGLDEESMQPTTIVGVVGDVRQDSPATPPGPMLYFPLEQHPYHANELQVIVSTTGAPGALTEAVRNAAHQLNPEMALRFTTLDDMVAESISAPRFRTFVAGTFGGLALLLAMAGVYGVMSFMVSQRTAELGLRMALGVMGSDVVRLVLRKAGVLALAGLLLGTALSLASSRLIGSLLFGLTATDTATYLIVFAVVGVIAGLAAAGPAWQASRIDPMVALRED
ncbi:MAG: putative transport system permease protein [Bryobacterales bacterium]|nr:putative transport system permease protein [Bryobacterales bacterium]